jgi:hypothetical protein
LKPTARDIERQIKLASRLYAQLADLAEKQVRLLDAAKRLAPFVLQRAYKAKMKTGHC